MTICFDIQSAIAQRAGVGRYARLLAEHLAATGDIELALFFFDFRKQAEPFEAGGSELRRVSWCPGRLAQFAWKTLDWPPFDFFAGPADIYHFPNFILPPLSRGRCVVTIHDMSFLRFPQFAEERNLRYLTARIRDTTERADAIITDSRFSAGEIAEFMNIEPRKLFPIHLGISPHFRPVAKDDCAPLLRELGVDGPYILTVGTLEPRKNLTFLVDMFERLSGFDGKLVLAGMRGWKYEPIITRIHESRRAADIVMLDYVPDSHLAALYSGAELFALTSFYEGFGFPPLEAMACGTPVISAATGSLPEVLGSAAVLIDGFELEHWLIETTRLLNDTALRHRLITDGRTRAANYTWHETARRTIEVYKTLGDAHQ